MKMQDKINQVVKLGDKPAFMDVKHVYSNKEGTMFGRVSVTQLSLRNKATCPSIVKVINKGGYWVEDVKGVA